MTTTIYGISNCQSVQKALKWLDNNNIAYTFWDYKKLGIDESHLKKWCNMHTWQKVLNQSGMMWRKASPEAKEKVIDQASAIEYMITTPTSIKRPILESDSKIVIGLNPESYATIFG